MTTALTDVTPGGAWTSGSTLVATVVGTSGVVTGVGAGTATIYYTVAGVPAAIVVTVNPVPLSIGGASTVCNGSSITLSDLTTGGTWTSTAGVSVTTGTTTTTVTGLTNGSNTVTYSLGTGCYVVYPVTVNPLPASISGTLGVCTSGVSFLSDATSGGAWTISPVGTATISPSGRVYGVSAGTATVTYTGPNTCITTSVVTVSATPSAIMGNTAICPMASITLTDATSGGTWLSSNPSVATIGSADGLLTGVAAGTTTVYYVTGAVCGVYVVATVNASPNAGTISGTGTVCVGNTTSLSDATPGGVWSSTTIAVGTVSTFGVVRGLTTGTTTISYTVTNSCGSAAATAVVTVGAAASAGTITGNAPVCAGSTLALSDAITGGSWTSSAPSVASIDAVTGLVAGISAGSANVYYTVTSSCGSVSTYAIVTVNAFTAGTISGASSVMAGLTITLSNAVSGGVWSATNGNATVSGVGLVTGITAGTVTISYTVTNICGAVAATKVVTVNASSTAPITGTATVCVGMTTALTDATAGGAWTTGNSLVATVGTSGIVTGVGAGTATIYYTFAGVPAAIVVTVNPNPSPIGGATSVCNGASITLSDFTAGGTWASTAGVSVTTGTTTTTVTGVTNGANTVTYSLSTGCYKTYAVTVKALPSAILGNLSVCGIGAVTFLSDATSGISWSISPVGTATVSPGGRVYGVSAGTATVSYTGSNNCISTAVVTVNTAVTVAPISGATNVSSGSTISLSDATAGGVWSSSNPALGSVDGTGNVTGVGISGVVNIYYSVAYGSGCTASVYKPITVHTPAPHGHGGSATTGVDGTVSIAGEAIAGEGALVEDGIAATTAIELLVNPVSIEVRLLPNPNGGTFTVRGSAGTKSDETVTIEITDMTGHLVYSSKGTATSGVINEQITLNSNLANGMYLLNVKVTTGSKVIHFVVEK